MTIYEEIKEVLREYAPRSKDGGLRWYLEQFTDKDGNVLEEREVTSSIRVATQAITSLLDREITAARIDEMLVATTAHRIAGGKGMPKGHQRRMRQLQARLEQLEGSDGVSPSQTSTSKETDKDVK